MNPKLSFNIKGIMILGVVMHKQLIAFAKYLIFSKPKPITHFYGVSLFFNLYYFQL